MKNTPETTQPEIEGEITKAQFEATLADEMQNAEDCEYVEACKLETAALRKFFKAHPAATVAAECGNNYRRSFGKIGSQYFEIGTIEFDENRYTSAK